MSFYEGIRKFQIGELELAELQSILMAELLSRPHAAQDCLQLIDSIFTKGRLQTEVYSELRNTITGNASLGPQTGVPPPGPSAQPTGGSGLPSAPDDYDPDQDSTRVTGRPDTATRITGRPRTGYPENSWSPNTGASQTGARQPPSFGHDQLLSSSSQGPASIPPLGLSSYPADSSPGSEVDGTVFTGDSGAMNVGDTLAGRYLLERVIGRGGMGVVYRAKDTKAQAAADRNPYVAIKLLNSDFKKHPDSLKALQREARKSQSLSHPNIVNIFNFDFDAQNAWLVMECLEGEPLSSVINHQRISHERAFSIIRQLGRALQHAHDSKPNPIVHCDFKPANAFLTKDGTIKVLDFGIARAAPTGQEDADNKTLFDAGTLEAQTPLYAAPEMAWGMDPDPRDDVYALACVAYELLSGRHPYGRSGIDAMRSDLKPDRIKGLTNKQWKALLEGLAFDRKNRTRSVRRFVQQLMPGGPSWASRVAIAAPLVLLVAALASYQFWYPPLQQQWQVYSAERALASEDDVAGAIAGLLAMPAPARDRILGKPENVDRVTQYYADQVASKFLPAEKRYDYPGALAQLQQAGEILPRNPDLDALRDDLVQSGSRELNAQLERRTAAMRAGVIIPEDGDNDLSTTLRNIRQIDPEHAAVTDNAVLDSYSDAARAARQQGDARRLSGIVTAGVGLLSSDAAIQALSSIGDDVPAEQGSASTRTAGIPDLVASLEAALIRQDNDTARSIEEDIQSSASASGDAMLGTNAIATVYLDVATAFKSNGDAETASALAARAQAMNPGAEIQASLARLTGQDPGRSVEADSEEDAQPSADDLRQQIDARIGAPQFLARDVAWSADRLAELEDLTGDSTAETERVIERILLSSDQLVQEGRENDAVQLLVYSAATFAEATEFPERLNQIEGGAPPPIRELSTAERLAFNVDNLLEQPSLEGTVFTQLKASLRRLEREVGDNAPLFLETRSRVSNEYGERAKAFAAQGDAEKAEAYLQSATELDPTFEDRVQIDTQGATGPAGWQNVAEARSAFDTAIAAGRVDEAAAIVQQLPAEMRSGDSFFQGEASLQIAEQYKQRALDAAESGDFETALDNIELGLEWSPEDATLIRWQSRYQRLTGATGSDAAADTTTDD